MKQSLRNDKQIHNLPLFRKVLQYQEHHNLPIEWFQILTDHLPHHNIKTTGEPILFSFDL